MVVIQPRRMDWCRDSVEKFWEYHSRRQDTRTSYFSRHYGMGIVNFVHAAGLLDRGTRVLDFGCGRFAHWFQLYR